jgi:glycosyltransferase involved in cell wall biosynthesis
MKIAIDARFFGPEGTGIGKYTEKLVENLQKLDDRNEYFIILRKNNWRLFNPTASNFKKVLADARGYSLKEQVLLPAVLLKIKPDLVHFPHFNIPLLYPGKFVVTIHDVTISEFKNVSSSKLSSPVYLLKHAAYKATINQAVTRAKKIFVPSDFTKKKICKAFGLSEGKVTTTYEAADEIFVRTKDKEVSTGRKREILAKYGIRQPFIIYVGRAAPHKNIRVVLEALRLLEGKIYLVHASTIDVFIERLKKQAEELGVADKYIAAGYVFNDDLVDLLKLAECFIFPSLSEGFGLPGIEAMAAGCPVVCSDIPVFKEVYEDAAVYFEPKKPKDIAKKIDSVIKNENLKMDLREEGFKQVKKYSWENLAKETLKVYKQLA